MHSGESRLWGGAIFFGFVENKKGKVSTQVFTEAKAQIELGQKILVEGNAQLELENYAEAFRLFQQAERQAQKAKLIIQAATNLNLGNRLNIQAASSAATTQANDDNQNEDRDRNDRNRNSNDNNDHLDRGENSATNTNENTNNNEQDNNDNQNDNTNENANRIELKGNAEGEIKVELGL